MKKNLLIGILLMSVLPYGLVAQELKEPKDTSGKKNMLVVKANNLYHFSKKPLNSFYSLGGEIGVYFKKFYFGLAQYSSLSPSDIWENKSYNPDKIRVYEYSLQAGYKFELAFPFYIYAGIRSGYGAMHMEYQYNNGVDSDETMTREKLGGVFATPEAKLGISIYNYFNVEAGLNYRYHIGNSNRWGLSTDKMNGLGAVISIVGNIPL